MKTDKPAALITGGAKRIGQQVARNLHDNGHNILVHYRSSISAAQALVDDFNQIRPDSAALVAGDLLDTKVIPLVIDACVEKFGRLDVLINNASTFYPTPIELIADEYWNDLIGSNLKAPAFMIKHAAKHLRETNGCIVNIIDIYARHPLPNHPIYCAAKAGLEMLTKALARDLAPDIRVNAVAPGAILWPEGGNSEIEQAELIERIPLGRMGEPEDIAKAIKFLVADAPYITGQTIVVDGGRSVVS
jgi:pteridine reductase